MRGVLGCFAFLESIAAFKTGLDGINARFTLQAGFLRVGYILKNKNQAILCPSS